MCRSIPRLSLSSGNRAGCLIPSQWKKSITIWFSKYLGRTKLQGASQCCGSSAPLKILLYTWQEAWQMQRGWVGLLLLHFVSWKGLDAPGQVVSTDDQHLFAFATWLVEEELKPFPIWKKETLVYNPAIFLWGCQASISTRGQTSSEQRWKFLF